MKLAEYSPEIIRFMSDASEYSAYHRDLAAKLSRYLSAYSDICDAGCGLGYLSLALSPYCKSVSAVDISPNALSVLTGNIRDSGCRNIQVVEGDIASCPPGEPYDAMVFCFFGHTTEALGIAKAQCRGKVIIIKRDREMRRFSLYPQPVARQTFSQTCSELSAMGIPFSSERFVLEMGQPFRSFGDAATFFRIYSSDGGSGQVSDPEVESRLVRLESGKYPYYFPCAQQLGIIVIDTGDIPDIKVKN